MNRSGGDAVFEHADGGGHEPTGGADEPTDEADEAATDRASADRADMLQGTLDLLILHALSLGPMHGWGISHRIRELSRDVLQVHQGSLYPALHRMEYRGWVHSEWGTSENNRRAKFYRLTDKGSGRLGLARDDWGRFAQAMQWVLDAETPEPTTA